MSASKNAVAVALLVALSGGAAQGQTGTVTGTVRAVGSDGRPFAIPGVRLTVECGSAAAATTVTDDQGQFTLETMPVGRCELLTDVQGFKPAIAAFHRAVAEPIDLPVSLVPDVLYTGLLVTGVPLDAAVKSTTPSTPIAAGTVLALRTPSPFRPARE